MRAGVQPNHDDAHIRSLVLILAAWHLGKFWCFVTILLGFERAVVDFSRLTQPCLFEPCWTWSCLVLLGPAAAKVQ